MALIPAPVLDTRSGERIAAEAIARVSGAQTVENIDRQIGILLELRVLAESGTWQEAVCPELTNTEQSAPHTALIEAIARLIEHQAFLINQLPRKIEIEFARLFGIMVREATEATTTLHFTVAPPPDTDVTIPEGTEVSTADGGYTFRTDFELVIPSGVLTDTVAATRTVAGTTLLSPNKLIRMDDAIAWVSSVTNPDAIDSGSEAETIDSALNRARNYQIRGERIVTEKDLQDAILEDVLKGNGIVRAFQLVKQGDWNELHAGHTTVVVMTRNASPVSDEIKQQIITIMSQAIGSQFIYVQDPLFVDFNIAVDVRLTGLASEGATKAAIKNNLVNFYAATAGNFGRPILRAEIIAVIEGTPGVDRIVAQESGDILASPLADIVVAPYELPRLGTVTIDVVP